MWVDNDIENSRRAYLSGLTTGLKNPVKGKRIIVAHIGSDDGFLDDSELIFEAKKQEGDYHGDMDANNFEKWFLDILNKLEPGSVVVMDKAPYHSRQVERLPNMSWRKEDIQAGPTNKGIAYERSEIKAELLSKIDKEKFKIKYIDYIANAKNITICRLPPYHCGLKLNLTLAEEIKPSKF
ncbi:uncharacterized protein LOC124541622 [Vanessa cardui]|uniref:uncharacterized protein LOC124541622 n=1 Tax=Vanessa cardui TaxID=171605 RepID=UPI001F135B6A|nr:uncharacterized protein LOC124541622 [Vanessa cardui]